MSSAKWHPFCVGLSVLTCSTLDLHQMFYVILAVHVLVSNRTKILHEPYHVTNILIGTVILWLLCLVLLQFSTRCITCSGGISVSFIEEGFFWIDMKLPTWEIYHTDLFESNLCICNLDYWGIFTGKFIAVFMQNLSFSLWISNMPWMSGGSMQKQVFFVVFSWKWLLRKFIRISLTHLPLLSHICISESGQHWFR